MHLGYIAKSFNFKIYINKVTFFRVFFTVDVSWTCCRPRLGFFAYLISVCSSYVSSAVR